MRRTLSIVAVLAMLATACTAAGAQTATTPSTAELAARLATAEATIAVMQRQIAAGEARAPKFAEAINDGQQRDASIGASLIALKDKLTAVEIAHELDYLRHHDGGEQPPIGLPHAYSMRAGHTYEVWYDLRHALPADLTLTLPAVDGLTFEPSRVHWAAGTRGRVTVSVTVAAEAIPRNSKHARIVVPTVTYGDLPAVRALGHTLHLLRDR